MVIIYYWGIKLKLDYKTFPYIIKECKDIFDKYPVLEFANLGKATDKIVEYLLHN